MYSTPQKLLRKLSSMGSDAAGDHLKNQVLMVNTVSLINSMLALTVGSALFLLTGAARIGVAAYIETILFSLVFLLNSKRHYQLAAGLTHLIMNAAVAYFGILFGKYVDVYLMAIFLVSLPMLIFNNNWVQAICITISVVTIAVIEANNRFEFIKPIEIEYNALYLRWVAEAIILYLDVAILYYNRKYITKREDKQKGVVKDLIADNLAKTGLMHDIRSWFNSIYGISQLMQIKKGEIDPSSEDVSTDLNVACHQVLRIINSSLDISRLSVGKTYELKKEPIVLKEWSNDILKIHRYSAAKKGIVIKFDLPPKMFACIEGDKEKLTRVADNLLTNAVRFSPKGTSVQFIITKTNDKWGFLVSDKGPGMTDNELEKAFQPFETSADSTSSGTGLGLYLVKQFVSQMGGNIQVSRNATAGLTFHVTGLTLKELPIPAPQPQLVVPDYSRLRFLLVDDNPMERLSIARLLKSIGAAVAQAETGAEAILYIKQAITNGTVPDVVLLDQQLPDKQGLELVQELRGFAELARTTIIIASGDTYLGIDQAVSAGANGHLLKPLDLNNLNLQLTHFALMP